MNSLCAVKNSLSCIPLYTQSLDTSIYYICSVLVTGKHFTGGNIIFCSNSGNFFFLNVSSYARDYVLEDEFILQTC